MRLIAFFSAVFLLSSCGEKFDFETKHTCTDSKFSWNEKLVFEHDFTDTTQRWDLFLDIEHLKTYPFQNIYLKLTTELPNGKSGEQLVSFDLADISGKWQGDCGGNSCTFEAVLREKLLFKPAGKYKITVEPYSRTNPLEGISELNLKLRKSGGN
jgi:gliding motility-associated lipoprotein GldH